MTLPVTQSNPAPRKTAFFAKGWLLILALGIILFLAWQTYFINCWPDDACVTYLPTAAKLSQVKFLSQMHTLPQDGLSRLNMHGKEALILGTAIMQNLLHDHKSLFPLILFLLIAQLISAIFLYKIFSKIFDRLTASIITLLFLTCAWSYLYVLMGAHQPLVLAAFLMTFYLLQRGRERQLFYPLAGISLGLMFFSSPTAFVYLPYFALLLVFPSRTTPLDSHSSKKWATQGVLFLFGFLLILFCFTWPDPFGYFHDLSQYLLANQAGNHFKYYQKELGQIIPDAGVFRGEGWGWVFRYCWLMLPVLFPAYLISLVYLFRDSTKRYSRLILICISLSTPFLAETLQVAQFGRNYFSWLVGMLFTLGYFVSDLNRNKQPAHSKKLAALLGLFLLITISQNAWYVFKDILPARMATTAAAQWLRKNHVAQVYVYQQHPHNPFLTAVLNNPKRATPISFIEITSVSQPKQGYLLVPPKRGRTIWINCMEKAYDLDPVLNWLFDSGDINKCLVRSFPSIVSSRIWAQEEEICTYLDLCLDKQFHYESLQSQILILDAQKINALLANYPNP